MIPEDRIKHIGNKIGDAVGDFLLALSGIEDAEGDRFGNLEMDFQLSVNGKAYRVSVQPLQPKDTPPILRVVKH